MVANLIEESTYLPSHEEDAQTLAIFEEASRYAVEREGLVEPYSNEEYFLMLLNKGIETRKEGNYGIAAATVIRKGGYELVIFGLNTVFSQSDPHGHAEMNAIENTRLAMSDPSGQTMRGMMEAGTIVVRNAPHHEEERFLVTTLEPCPMCTVGSVINADMKSVVIGIADDYAGGMLDGRLEALAPLWAATAAKQELKVTLIQSEHEDDPSSYAPPVLVNLLRRLFFDTKDRLDTKLEQEGYMDPRGVFPLVQGLLHG